MRLLQAAGFGMARPRRVLVASEPWLLDLASERVLDNANTPDEHDGAHAALQSQRRS